MSVLGWVIAAVVLIGLELLSLDLILLMLAGGAVAAAFAAAFGAPFMIQVVVAAVVSVVLLGFVRPVALRHLQVPRHTRTGVEALVGTTGFVLERVDRRDGRVKLGGEVWSARTADASVVYEPGLTVHVVRIDGATAVVAAEQREPQTPSPGG
ncbi:MAG TPA: NfeD family protein [Actinomycetes bacterium]|nr:NfeD family protein [Actinomycetes bacterium]